MEKIVSQQLSVCG